MRAGRTALLAPWLLAAAAALAALGAGAALAPALAAGLATGFVAAWLLMARAARRGPAPGGGVEALKAIALAMEARDPYTRGHCLRVRHLARGLLARLGVPPAERRGIELAAFLHDVGKVGVSDVLLQKEGRLTADEKRRIMLHVDIGVELLAAVPELRETCLLVKHHHEKFDGSGYPDGLRGDAIPFGSRVIAVADAIDAMRSTRPYRPALPLEVVLEELRRSSGSQLDPRIASAGIDLLSARSSPGAQARPSATESANSAESVPEKAGALV